MNVKEFGDDVELAIKFMTAQFSKADKEAWIFLPHSFRVGMMLFECKYSLQIVIAGFLHDLIEKTNTTKADITRAFGHEVAALVVANTKDESIVDKAKQREDLVKRVIDEGEASAILRAVDVIDNAKYAAGKSNHIGQELLDKLPPDFSDAIFKELRKNVA